MTAIQQIDVPLGANTHAIHIGFDLISSAQPLLARYQPVSSQAVLIHAIDLPDSLVAKVTDWLVAAQLQVTTIAFDDREVNKTWGSLEPVFDAMIASGQTRRTTVFALGGGVVGDCAGFVASCYMRGVDCIQIPTTLLAQVDSSIGGKTGVNHSLGKNLLGSFKQPKAVFIDLNALETLPQSDYISGLAEVVKYGIISDTSDQNQNNGQFFLWLYNNTDALLSREQEALSHAVVTSCRTKASIVADDETEQQKRALLNFGHTFGHAIEQLTNYSSYTHGEAVAIGMCMAADFACALSRISEETTSQIRSLIANLGLPTSIDFETTASDFLQAMSTDKKKKSQYLTLVLPTRIGSCETVELDRETTELLLQSLEQFVVPEVVQEIVPEEVNEAEVGV